jgi:hypothetical protein
VLVGLALIGGAIYEYGNPSKNQNLNKVGVCVIGVDSPCNGSNQSDATANWKTYTDDPYSLQFKYPANWSVKACHANRLTIGKLPENFSCNFLSLDGLDFLSITVDDLESIDSKLKGVEKDNIQNYTLNGQQMIKVVTDISPIVKDNNNGTKNIDVLTSFDNRTYELDYLDTDKSNNSINDTIISTFKIIAGSPIINKTESLSGSIDENGGIIKGQMIAFFVGADSFSTSVPFKLSTYSSTDLLSQKQFSGLPKNISVVGNIDIEPILDDNKPSPEGSEDYYSTFRLNLMKKVNPGTKLEFWDTTDTGKWENTRNTVAVNSDGTSITFGTNSLGPLAFVDSSDISTWQNQKNATYNFQISYPGDWKAKNSANIFTFYDPSLKDETCSIVLTIGGNPNPKITKTNDWVFSNQGIKCDQEIALIISTFKFTK